MSTFTVPTASLRNSAVTEIHGWMDNFAACVRSADYAQASRMFDPNVVSFGTVARMVRGIDVLIRDQWQNIWGCTRGFHFIEDEAHINALRDLAWIASPWLSQGRDERGNWYDRNGRCTLVLARHDEKWLCVHSHFSRKPTPQLRGSATPA